MLVVAAGLMRGVGAARDRWWFPIHGEPPLHRVSLPRLRRSARRRSSHAAPAPRTGLANLAAMVPRGLVMARALQPPLREVTAKLATSLRGTTSKRRFYAMLAGGLFYSVAVHLLGADGRSRFVDWVGLVGLAAALFVLLRKRPATNERERS